MTAVQFDNSKHDIQLNGVPYRISGYQRSELSTFIPRLSSGEQEESTFDLLRSTTIKRFTGGSLQRYWNDDTSAFGIEGLYPKYEDGVLYPVNEPQTLSTNNPLGTSKAVQTAYCVTENYVFIAGITYNSPTPFIKRIATDGTVTNITIPASLSGSGSPVTSMCIYNEQLWVFSGYVSGAVWYMATTATTLTEITGGSGYITMAVVFRGSLYGTGSYNNNGTLYKYTGNTTTRNFELVGNIFKSSVDSTHQCFVYNNRIFITRREGMFAYDGVQMVTIEDQTQNISRENYRFPAVLRGYLYYFMPDGWYRFNGSLIEKLYDRSEVGFPVDVITAKNRIWILYRNSQVSGTSRYDKSMGYDYGLDDEPADGRVAVYNGTGLYTYGRTPTITKNPATVDVEDQGEVYRMFWINEQLYITTYYEKTVGNEYYKIDTDELEATGNKSWRLITSIFDGDFPMIYKQLEEIEIAYDGATSPAKSILVEARTENTVGGFEEDGGWFTLTTVTGPGAFSLYNASANGNQFKKIQFRLSGDFDPTVGIEKFIMRYTLQPDYKNQWVFTALCYGDMPMSRLQLQDSSEETISAGTLRGNIYKSRESNKAVPFLDIDSVTLDEDINNSVLTVAIVSGQADVLKADEGYLQIDTEIVAYQRDTDTSIILTRGQFGTTATSHTSGAKFYPFYKTIVRSIQNERVELTDEELTSTSSRTRDSEITIVLQEV